ncbi:MAG: LuxR C-terminal-related transcriptional regulator [Polyangiaceae bacterium]|nr:LuxR C-terminal-related transcriptional regulator [Polyangiaceae bacterium]
MGQKALFLGIDDETFRSLQNSLHQEPYGLLAAQDLGQAWDALQQSCPDVVLALEDNSSGSGVSFLSEVQKKYPHCVRLLITDGSQVEPLIKAVNEAQVFRILKQPLNAAPLAKILREAMMLARVTTAQEAVWSAARKQEEAIRHLQEPDSLATAQTDQVILQSRHAGASTLDLDSSNRIGELPEEKAKRLSSRELEIVQALSSGQRVKDIAQELIISTHTVRNHLKAIYRKLNVRSQFELISLMARHSKDA